MSGDPVCAAARGWCRLYTLLALPELRRRRRDEVASHLWESRAAGVASARVALAVVRGAPADVGWALRAYGLHVARLARDPLSWLVLALAATITGAESSMVLGDRAWIGLVEMGGLAAAVLLVLMALGVHVRRRRD